VDGAVTTTHPLTVRSLIDEVVDRSPGALALVTPEVRCTYGELRETVERAAGVLRDLGVGADVTVAAATSYAHDAVVSFLACMWLGARWVGVNPALAAAQQVRLVTRAEAAVVLTSADLADEMGSCPGVRHVVAEPGWATSLDVDAGAGTEGPTSWSTVDPHAPAAIAFTSGTTGEPKGVVHSQRNLALPARYLASTVDFAAPAVIGVCLPTTSLNVLVVCVLPAFAAGVPCVVLPGSRSDVVADWVRREGVTTMTIPPPTVIDLATRDGIEIEAMAPMAYPRSGGAALSDDAVEAYATRFGRRVMRTYGLSEVPTLAAYERRDEPPASASAGRVVPYLRAEVRTADGAAAEPGAVGEIWISGAIEGSWAGAWTPMLGYWRDPLATEATLVDGWIRTGDLGRISEAGVLSVAGRASGVINRGGVNVHAADVEAALRSLPGVLDAAVVGIPDPRLGERVAAAVVLRDGRDSFDADALAAACRERLARYEVPEVLLAVEELPRNSMGKVLAGEVRRTLTEPSNPRPR
jgi:long-chain acyl-CoA synthetase